MFCEPYRQRENVFLEFFANLSKIKNSHLLITLNQILYRGPFAAHKALSLLESVSTSFNHLDLESLSSSSCQIFSSSTRLGGKRQWISIFKSLHTFSRFYVPFHRVCLGSLLCWKADRCSSLRSCALWSRFFFKVLAGIGCIHPFLNSDQSLCTCCREAPQQHDASITMPLYRMLVAGWYAVPGFGHP